MKIILETKRLLLREMTDDDFDALKKVISDKETNEMIGDCGVSMQCIDDEDKPEIGYHLRKDYHRQGLGK